MADSLMAKPFTMVLFGATGDLAKRKLFPALFSLFKNKALPDHFRLIGVGRSKRNHEAFRQSVRDSIDSFGRLKVTDENEWNQFIQHFYYTATDVNQAEGYQEIKAL